MATAWDEQQAAAADERAAELYALHWGGMDMSEISRKYGKHRIWANKIINRYARKHNLPMPPRGRRAVHIAAEERARRNAAIVADHEAGLSLEFIAEKYELDVIVARGIVFAYLAQEAS